MDFVETRLVANRTIEAADLHTIVVTDSPERATETITAIALEQFGLTSGPRLRPRWYFGERRR